MAEEDKAIAMPNFSNRDLQRYASLKTVGIGRLKFLVYSSILHFIFSVSFKALSDMNSQDNLGILSLIYSILISLLIKRRLQNIGHYYHAVILAFTWCLISIFYYTSMIGLMGMEMSYIAASIGFLVMFIIGVPANIYLLLMPNVESWSDFKDSFKEKRKIKKLKKNLIQEKSKIMALDEIERLKTEIETLKAEKK